MSLETRAHTALGAVFRCTLGAPRMGEGAKQLLCAWTEPRGCCTVFILLRERPFGLTSQNPTLPVETGITPTFIVKMWFKNIEAIFTHSF